MAYPTLNANEIYSALYNMIISQQVFDRISTGSSLVDKARVDGGLYGDTKLFYGVDVLASHAWGNDAEADNLLELARAKAPETQAVVLDTFRQIRISLDSYLSKRGWMDEGSFGQFNSIMEGMVGKTKDIYDETLYNAFLGTKVIEDQVVEVELSGSNDAQIIAQRLADLEVELTNPSRKFNEYGHMTKFSPDEIMVVWNSAYVNKIKKLDLPTIFHKDSVFADFKNVLPASYFGTIVTSKVVSGSMMVHIIL